jgi:hypothetical protein
VLAAVLIAELGTDMSVFKSAKHLAAWAGYALGTTRAPANANGLIPAKGTSIS